MSVQALFRDTSKYKDSAVSRNQTRALRRSESRLEIDPEAPAACQWIEGTHGVELEHESRSIQANAGAGAAEIARRERSIACGRHPETAAVAECQRFNRQCAVIRPAAPSAGDRNSQFGVRDEKARRAHGVVVGVEPA